MAEIHTLPRHRTSAPPLSGLPEPCSSCRARSLTICAALSDDEQVRLGRIASMIRIKPHQALFHDGDDADYVYNITCGSVALSKSMMDGRRQITGFLGAGDFLGLNAGDTHSITAEALTETQLCRFPRRPFRRLLAEIPSLEHRLLALAETELALARGQILLLGRKTAMERIASFLLLESERIVSRGLPGSPVSLPMSRADVADYLGLTIETVSRCFTRLRKLDVIALPAPDRVQIRQPDRLKALSEAA